MSTFTPIFFNTLLVSISPLTDILLSSRFDANVLGAVSLSIMIIYMPVAFIFGVLHSFVPNISFLKNEGDLTNILELIINNILVVLVLSIFFYCILHFFANYFFYFLGINDHLIPDINVYLKLAFPIILLMSFFNLLRYFSEAYELSTLVTISLLFVFILKVITIYLLVFTQNIDESWGVMGFAVSNILYYGILCLVLLSFLFTNKKFKTILSSRKKSIPISIRKIYSFIIYGLPNGLNFAFEPLVFAVTGLLIATLAISEISAYAIIISILNTCLIFSSALSMLSTILVGQSKSNRHNTLLIIRTILSINFLMILFILMNLYFFKNEIMAWYKPNQSTLSILDNLFNHSMVILFLWSFYSVYSFILRGLSDFVYLLYISFIRCWLIFIPLGYVLGNTDYLFPVLGLSGWMYSFIISLAIANILIIVRLSLKGKYLFQLNAQGT